MARVSANEYQHELLNENDGFPSSIIFSIVQDEHGFLWFGTGYSGMMRYDGENVVTIRHQSNNPNSLPHDNTGNLTFDSNGDLWIGSWGGSLIKLEMDTQLFSHFKHAANDDTTISDPKVQHIFEDANGTLWFGTNTGGLNRLNPDNKTFKRYGVENAKENGISDKRVWDIAQSDPENLWVATTFGLNKLNINDNTFKHLFPEPDSLLSELNRIRVIKRNDNGDLYLGTQNGVVFFDTKSEEFRPIPSPDVSKMGPIYAMLETNFGEYWVSSDFGVFSFTDADTTLRKVPLNFDDRCSQTLFQDKQGTIWLSCEGIGIYKITRTSIFQSFDDQLVKTAFALEMANDESLLIGTSQMGIQKWDPKTNTLSALVKDEKDQVPEIRFITQTANNDIWYANSQSLFKLDASGKQIQLTPPNKWWLDFENIKDLEKDRFNNVWVGTPARIFIINAETLSFESILLDPEVAVGNAAVEIYVDPENTMWVAVNNTLYQWNEAERKLQLISLSTTLTEYTETYDYIYTIFIDSQQQLWVSNKTGFYQVDQTTGERMLISEHFNERDNRGIRFISEDENGILWLVTPVGVSRFNPADGLIQDFDKRDGLPGSRYFYNPTLRKSDGSIYLSSRDGISYFSPASVRNRSLDEPTELTKFEVLGSSEPFNIFDIQASGVSLQYDQTNIKFEFSTLDLLNARQIQYSYFLDGFDTSWIENGTNNTATYTNLSGGDYVFRVRAKVKDNRWYQHELAVNLSIGIPIWQRWWMFAVYIVLISLAVLYYLQRQKRAVIQLEQQVADKTADIAAESEKLAIANRIKTQFLANMSHEIRTPLTTVIGQAEAIICRDVKPEDIYKEVEIIHDSSLYLLALLNDILDLTKIEENKFELEYAPQDLHSLLININTMFSMQARVKGLTFTLAENLPRPFVIDVDGLRLKQILINLLSNALKFTLKGHVKLEIVIENEHLIFHVEDTGIGISQNKVEQIFGSFTQGDSSIRRRFGGSGLGLHLSNQLALLMGGRISVDSRVDEGSVFTFSMPMPSVVTDSHTPQVNLDLDAISSEPLFQGKILLAEDHADNRRLITRLLSKLGLTVFTAADGFEAIELYKEHAPEVILMDIQMPKMDGIQAYKALRELACEEPIIALTANAMKNEVEDYFSLGFDGYIQKPIDRQLLISTIATFFSGNDDDTMRRANSMLGNVDMSDLVAEFKTSLIKELASFTLESEKQDVHALKALAHRLSGASFLFGFSELSKKASELETKIKNEQLSFAQLAPFIDELMTEIRRIIG